MVGQGQVEINPKAGRISSYRFVAKHWDQDSKFFEALGVSPKSLYRLRQDLKNNYPEVFRRVNPLVANQVLS